MLVIHSQQGRSSLWQQSDSVKGFSNVLLMHKRRRRSFPTGVCQNLQTQRAEWRKCAFIKTTFFFFVVILASSPISKSC